MDDCLPIARRTRLQEEKYWKEVWEKKHGKRKSRDDSDESKKKRGSGYATGYVSVDESNVSDDEGEADFSPPTEVEYKRKGGKRKSTEGSRTRSVESVDVSEDGEEPSVQIIGDASCRKEDTDSEEFDGVESAGSKSSEKMGSLGPVGVEEDSDDDVVFLGVKGEERSCGGFESSVASEDAVSSSSDEPKALSSAEETSNSEDKDYNPEKSESSGFSEELSSCGGEDQSSDDGDEGEIIKRSGKLGKRKSVEVSMKGKKKHGLISTDVDIDKRREELRKGKSVEVDLKGKKNFGLGKNDDSVYSRSQKKRMKSGSSSQLLCDDEDNVHEKKTGSHYRRNDEKRKYGLINTNDDIASRNADSVNSRGEKKRMKSGPSSQALCEDEDDVHENKTGSHDRRKDENDEIHGVKRKRRFVLAISVDADAEIDTNKDDPVDSGLKFNSVAQGAQSRVSRRREKEKIKSGSPPLCLVEDDLNSSPGHDDHNEVVGQADCSRQGTSCPEKKTGGHGDHNEVVDQTSCSGQETSCLEKKTGPDDRTNDENGEMYGGSPENVPDKWNDVHIVSNKNKGVMGKLPKRMSMWERKDCNVFNILLNSIYEKREVTLEGSASSGDEAPKGERDTPAVERSTLPLRFYFGEKEPSVLKKAECDPEEKELWDELDFVLRASEIECLVSDVVENEDSIPNVSEVDTATLCRRGKHQLILDEEIGLICKFCSYIDQEIKHIVPELVDSPCERYGKRGLETDKLSIFDDLQFHNSGSDPHSSCNSHAPEGTVWDFIPGVKSSLYPHQREGFEFIWNHIAGGIHLEKLKKTSSADGGNGCIISHAPGTGKTRLTIVFLQTYLELFPKRRPLLIAPRTMLFTWEEEFRKWKFDIPFYNFNNNELSGEEVETAVSLMKRVQGRKSVNGVNNSRMLKLYSWTKKRSILGISYHLFEKLSRTDHSGAQKVGLAEEMRKILLEFPSVVIFDEGHTPRNNETYMWKALSEIKTKRRILLSGTPFQNNFHELFNTICLVRPTFAPSIEASTFSRDFHRNRGRKSNEKWQWTSPTDSSGKSVDEKEKHAAEVKAKIAPFVNVYKGSVLQDSLPGLRNSVVVLHPSQLQERFHKRIQVVKEQFRYEHLEAIISIHPSLLSNDDAFSGDWDKLKELRLSPDAGVKAKFVIELIRLSDAMNERVLVFSQYIDPLILTRDLLKAQFQWREEEEVLYMDGKCDMKQRQSSMKIFNNPCSKAKVLLASTKGCCEGISLVGASRVVILDVTRNPSVERQAISRAYRLGQKKIVYVYHLLMAGTNEEHKYHRQVDKSRLSELVFSDSGHNALEKIRAAVSEDKILEEMAQHQNLKHIFESIAVLHENIYFEQLGLSTFG